MFHKGSSSNVISQQHKNLFFSYSFNFKAIPSAIDKPTNDR